ncbi:MAG: hypothetical protein NTZ24_10445 [Deltaproteobacteria bacterium]|nr:hypothetical protein [Deltaproteobacteria bacterium]
MNKDQKIILFIVSIPLVAMLTVFMISKVTFGLSLSPMERKLFNFNHENIPKIAERSIMQTGLIKSPITLTKSSVKGFPDTPLVVLSPPSSPASSAEKRVSMILINKNKKIAIIDGKFLNEGDVIGKHKVTRIEKNRVLLKNKEGEKWLKLE